jgi:hypothetical protein
VPPRLAWCYPHQTKDDAYARFFQFLKSGTWWFSSVQFLHTLSAACISRRVEPSLQGSWVQHFKIITGTVLPNIAGLQKTIDFSHETVTPT